MGLVGRSSVLPPVRYAHRRQDRHQTPPPLHTTTILTPGGFTYGPLKHEFQTLCTRREGARLRVDNGLTRPNRRPRR
jgi:hypothetical protein